MRQLLRYNFVALPLLMTAMVALLACLVFYGHKSTGWLHSVAALLSCFWPQPNGGNRDSLCQLGVG